VLPRSKLSAGGYDDPGGAAATIPLLSVRDPNTGRPSYEMPPSYETACGAVAERLMAGDAAVCTITGSNPSAVAFRSYPAALQGIPGQLSSDLVYQGSAMMPEWRCSSEEYGGSSMAAKRTLPMSPTHMQAMQQCAVQRHQHYPQPSRPDHGLIGPWQAPSHRRVHHYPTPPSQHSYAGPTHDVGPGGVARAPLPIHHPEQFLTPSPDSPGQWSSSSPHSGQSDWSEGMSSPAQAATYQNQPAVPNNQRLSQGRDGIFLVRT